MYACTCVSNTAAPECLGGREKLLAVVTTVREGEGRERGRGKEKGSERWKERGKEGGED